MSREELCGMFDSWLNNGEERNAVAISLVRRLAPAQTGAPIVFPPRYAKINYNIDRLSDGVKTVVIDSYPSQANRYESLFKAPRFVDWLVPQIDLCFGNGESRSFLDLPHRAGDILVHTSLELRSLMDKAFEQYRRERNAFLLCAVAPTSLLFGFWDSRGNGVKRGRIVRSSIRAWGIEELTTSSQYVPGVSHLSEELREAAVDVIKRQIEDEQKKKTEEEGSQEKEKQQKPKYEEVLSQLGLTHVPAAEAPGGVFIREDGWIEQQAVINLVSIRSLNGCTDSGEDCTRAIQRYILGLALYAMTHQNELYLREGCLLRIIESSLHVAYDYGEPELIDVPWGELIAAARSYALGCANYFRSHWERIFPIDSENPTSIKFAADMDNLAHVYVSDKKPSSGKKKTNASGKKRGGEQCTFFQS